MPKPDRAAIMGVLTNVRQPGASWSLETVDHLVALFTTWADEDEAERERGRNALALIETYGLRHTPTCSKHCGNSCNCGVDDALAALRGGEPEPWCPSDAEIDAALDEATGANDSEEDVEQFNRAQHLRRGAYASALYEQFVLGTQQHDESSRLAARRYPLKKRVPATIQDPHTAGQWRLTPDSEGVGLYVQWHNGIGWGQVPGCVVLTPARVRALAALLDNPWTTEDDVSVEETP